MIYAVIDTNDLKHYPQTPKVISPADFIRIVMEMQEE